MVIPDNKSAAHTVFSPLVANRCAIGSCKCVFVAHTNVGFLRHFLLHLRTCAFVQAMLWHSALLFALDGISLKSA